MRNVLNLDYLKFHYFFAAGVLSILDYYCTKDGGSKLFQSLD